MNAYPAITIGIPCHCDFDGVYFTVQCLRMFHSEVMPEAEIVVVDNAPGSHHGALTRELVQATGPPARAGNTGQPCAAACVLPRQSRQR